MSNIEVTVRVQITQPDGSRSVHERRLTGRELDNPRFYARLAEERIRLAAADVLSSIESVHGKPPSR